MSCGTLYIWFWIRLHISLDSGQTITNFSHDRLIIRNPKGNLKTEIDWYTYFTKGFLWENLLMRLVLWLDCLRYCQLLRQHHWGKILFHKQLLEYCAEYLKMDLLLVSLLYWWVAVAVDGLFGQHEILELFGNKKKYYNHMYHETLIFTYLQLEFEKSNFNFSPAFLRFHPIC